MSSSCWWFVALLTLLVNPKSSIFIFCLRASPLNFMVWELLPFTLQTRTRRHCLRTRTHRHADQKCPNAFSKNSMVIRVSYQYVFLCVVFLASTVGFGRLHALRWPSCGFPLCARDSFGFIGGQWPSSGPPGWDSAIGFGKYEGVFLVPWCAKAVSHALMFF